MPDVASLMYHFPDQREHNETSNRSSATVPSLSAQALGTFRATVGADKFLTGT